MDSVAERRVPDLKAEPSAHRTAVLTLIELPGQRSRAVELYDYLREAIADGRLQPGDRLVETRIARMASVSRTPVREAIRMLDADGLVRPSNDGLIVSGLSAQELLDLCVVREALEGLATRLAASARSEIDMMTLDRLVEQCEAAVAAGDLPRLSALSHAFHETIWQSTGNRYLAGQLRDLKSRVDRNQESTLLSPGRVEASIVEHRQLLAALSDRDADRAQSVAEAHFRMAMAIRLAKIQAGSTAGET